MKRGRPEVKPKKFQQSYEMIVEAVRDQLLHRIDYRGETFQEAEETIRTLNIESDVVTTKHIDEALRRVKRILGERKQGNPGTVFVEIRMLKDAPPITGSDMKTYGPFREKRVYAIPKENARVFIKHGIAKATRKEAEKPTLKEMFKGEVLTPYVEAAKVQALVETDEEKVIAQIVENAKYWASNICKRVTLEKYCIEKKGVKNPSEILDNLIRRGIAYTPRKGYIGLTEPEKYGLPPIEEVKLNTGKLADVFLELLKKAGVSLPSRFKGEFEVALDINKSYEENVKLIEAAAKRIILLEKTERVLGEIREARSE